MTEEHFATNDSTEKSEATHNAPTEPSAEQKKEISNWVAEGVGLSDIQKRINNDFGLVIIYKNHPYCTIIWSKFHKLNIL